MIDPIWLLTEEEQDLPIDEEKQFENDTGANTGALDDDDVTVEDVGKGSDDTTTSGPSAVKEVKVDKWVQMNAHPPLWMRSIFGTADHYKASDR